jgi:UPF0716 family protein affecting phage T7 exclusion
VSIDWSALGLVVLISLVAGCGLVALVGLGIVALDRRVTAQESGGNTTTPTLVMGLCFLAAVALIAYGLYLVAFA